MADAIGGSIGSIGWRKMSTYVVASCDDGQTARKGMAAGRQDRPFFTNQ